MIAPPKPGNEAQRLATLSQLDILKPNSEERFDRITRVAAALFDVPYAMVNFIDKETQLIKSCFGMEGSSVVPRDTSLCAHTILSDKPTIITNALEDEHFKNHPNVTGGYNVRAYAGVPLRAADGTHPGALCLIDTKPREFTENQINLLIDLSAWAEIEVNSSQLRQAMEQVKISQASLEAQLKETKHLNDLMIGRELKMIEMKKQIQGLSARH